MPMSPPILAGLEPAVWPSRALYSSRRTSGRPLAHKRRLFRPVGSASILSGQKETTPARGRTGAVTWGFVPLFGLGTCLKCVRSGGVPKKSYFRLATNALIASGTLFWLLAHPPMTCPFQAFRPSAKRPHILCRKRKGMTKYGVCIETKIDGITSKLT